MNPTRQQSDLWIAMNLAQRLTSRKINEALKQAELPSLAWYDILWVIERTDGGIRPFEIGAKVLFEQSNLSKLLRRMADDGLVEERPFKSDRRGKILRITKKGRSVRRKMWAIYGPLIREQMSKLPERYDSAILAAGLSHLFKDVPNSVWNHSEWEFGCQ